MGTRSCPSEVKMKGGDEVASQEVSLKSLCPQGYFRVIDQGLAYMLKAYSRRHP